MEYLQNKKNKVDEIIVDENFQLSEDAKFGHELAKNSAEWYRYFNQQLPNNVVKTSVFDEDSFDKFFG